MTLPSLSIFSTAKPFRGEIARIQRNAVRSWLALKPRPEIILLGNDEGVGEVCREFGLIHVRDVATAPSGAPYLDDLFAKARQAASGELLCYVNADIILLQDFLAAAERVFEALGPSIVIAAPYNVPVTWEVDSADPTAVLRLRALIERGRNGPTPIGADVFLFPRLAYLRVPGVVVGRWWWDNLLMALASESRFPAVDITAVARAIHQEHRGSTHSGRWVDDPLSEQERLRNIASVSGPQRFFWRQDLEWSLRADGSLRRRPLPRLTFLARYLAREASQRKLRLLERTFRFRRAIGLYRWWRHA